MKTLLISISVVGLVAGPCLGQSAPNEVSLCLLQQSIRQGEHQRVRTSGVVDGEELNGEVLIDSICPEELTWLEAALPPQKNTKELARIAHRHYVAHVVIVGEFYGPPNPDPKLPDKFRENYHPNWGHLGCCRTKLVVHKLIEVRAVPRDPTQ